MWESMSLPLFKLAPIRQPVDWGFFIFIANFVKHLLSTGMKFSIGKLFLVFAFFYNPIFAQKNDSISKEQSTTLVFFNQNQFETPDSIFYNDNSLHNFQNYFDRNNLGNSGSPYNDLVLKFNNAIGFNYLKNNYSNYLYNPQSLKYYETRTPYSDLFYLTGSKKEQVFRMIFSYNIRKKWNITANFSRIRSDGFYKRQNTNDNCIALNSNYSTKNNRYNILVSLIYNSFENAENGGIVDDSVFENSGGPTRNLFEINLDAAKRSTQNRSVFIKQYFNFGSKEIDTTKISAIFPSRKLILTTLYEDNLLKYQDDLPLSDFYSNIYYDSVQTFDSTFNSKIESGLEWKKFDNKKHRGVADMLGFGIGIKDQFVLVKQREIDTTLNNIFANVQFYNLYSNHTLWWNIKTNYKLTGLNKNNYSIIGAIKKNIKDSLNILIFRFNANKRAPDFIYNQYSSNNFKWKNNYSPTEQISFGISFEMKKYKFLLGANYSIYKNTCYFDNYAIARQYIGSISVISANVKKDFVLLNWHLNNSIIYQYVPDSTIIRLPILVLEHSLYYENDVFKKAMILQIGASANYNTSYYANAYMPATGQFYLQNEKKYGAYPYIDFFINAHIKTVRIFFKVDHINAGLMGNKYMQTSNYPMNGRAFKLGVSWRFFD